MDEPCLGDQSPYEPDHRFPSGPWRGYWIQHGYCDVMELWLEFSEGGLTGFGCDPAGDFEIIGSYCTDSGHMNFIKQYIDAHAIEYRGFQGDDGSPAFWGIWKLCGSTVSDAGDWRIWPIDFGEDYEFGESSRAGFLCRLRNPRVLVECVIKGLPILASLKSAIYGP